MRSSNPKSDSAVVKLLTKAIAANIDFIRERGKCRRLARSVLAVLDHEGYAVVRREPTPSLLTVSAGYAAVMSEAMQ